MDRGIVLIVENEALIRMSARGIIEDAGFKVVEACNADEAITILEARADIRAVFTDITMDGSIDGWKLAHAIRGRWPPIHLILTSGRMVPFDGPLPTNGQFIAKPYRAEHVTAALRGFFGDKHAP